MRVKDEVRWHGFLSALSADKDERAAAFRQFLITWAEAAEMVMRQDYAAVQGAWGDFDNDPLEDILLGGMPAIKALRETLVAVEKQLGAISTGFIGQCLVVLEDQWYFGVGLRGQMTPIEENLFRSAEILKQLKLQVDAQEMGDQ
jgi:hypothetical protein